MSNTHIDILIEIMENCHIDKDELFEAIQGVHYYSALPSPVAASPLPRAGKFLEPDYDDAKAGHGISTECIQRVVTFRHTQQRCEK